MCATRQSDFRIHEYNPDFYILRQSGCTNYEKPFLYLIFGDGQALLVDTGAKGARVADAIAAALKRWADTHGKPVPRLVAAHSHAHGDHVAGDSALAAIGGVTVVGTSPEAVERFFGLKMYPGRLYVADAAAFTKSVRRLVEFTRDLRVAHVLGTHIEEARTPFLDYSIGTRFQPDEHVLELSRGHLLELNDALEHMGTTIVRRAMADFTIWPK